MRISSLRPSETIVSINPRCTIPSSSNRISACANILAARMLTVFSSCMMLSLYSRISASGVYCSDSSYRSSILTSTGVVPNSCSLILCSICQICFFWIRCVLRICTRRKSRLEFVVIFFTSTSAKRICMSLSTFSVGNTLKKVFSLFTLSNLTTPDAVY